jgi:hypothetical protein
VDDGELLEVLRDYGVDDGVQRVEGNSGVWSTWSIASCCKGEDRLEVVWASAASVDDA